MMKVQFLVALGFLAVAPSFPADALDCAKASMPIEKLLCSTSALRKADDEMSAAYFRLLHETKDADFHELLIRSQRRWMQQRLHGPPRFGLAEGDMTDDREVLLKMARDRRDFLSSGTPIRTMADQRKIAAKESGGPFAGYRASCSFWPPPYGNWNYGCLIGIYRQHHNRICSVEESWASGHLTDYRFVNVVKNGKPKMIARCSIGYAETSEPCPDWNTNLDSAIDLMPTPDTSELWRYQPDPMPWQSDQSWMNDCLFAPVFPPQKLSRPSSTP